MGKVWRFVQVLLDGLTVDIQSAQIKIYLIGVVRGFSVPSGAYGLDDDAS